MKAGKGHTEQQRLAASNGVELGLLLLAPLRQWQSVVAGEESGVRAAVSLVLGRRGRDDLLSLPFPWDLAQARELGANGDELRRPGAVRLGVDREHWVWKVARCARRGSALPLIGAGLGVQAPFGPAVQRQWRRQRDSKRQRARYRRGAAVCRAQRLQGTAWGRQWRRAQSKGASGRRWRLVQRWQGAAWGASYSPLVHRGARRGHGFWTNGLTVASGCQRFLMRPGCRDMRKGCPRQGWCSSCSRELCRRWRPGSGSVRAWVLGAGSPARFIAAGGGPGGFRGGWRGEGLILHWSEARCNATRSINRRVEGGGDSLAAAACTPVSSI
ncbi:hypothetical protein E2562_022768 [Oryza meyeriana var. granulata]|uniref:Uncharacterized protein n=1 Tax=Oryza meyeriana var. granulata TaxID=110450 RepID=A0A6G1FAV8_9ORYZ|nr:hypothetical protein E2562_022768 [Oryza meyeriana var. granulata]